MLQHRGLTFDFDYPEDFELMEQVMRHIASGAIEYSLEERTHEKHFKGGEAFWELGLKPKGHAHI